MTQWSEMDVAPAGTIVALRAEVERLKAELDAIYEMPELPAWSDIRELYEWQVVRTKKLALECEAERIRTAEERKRANGAEARAHHATKRAGDAEAEVERLKAAIAPLVELGRRVNADAAAATEGPWAAYGYDVVTDLGITIALAMPQDHSAYDQERFANANLIAAAPDMAAALVAIAQEVDHDPR